MNHPPCLTLRKNLARSVVVGFAPTLELENVNVLADKPIAKPCTGGRCKRRGGEVIPITLRRGVCRSAGHGSSLRNRCVCPPLSRLPWDIAQSEFGVQGADFLGVMGKVLLRPAQSEFRAYLSDSKRVVDTLPPPVAQSEILAYPPDSTQVAGTLPPAAAQSEIRSQAG